MYWRAACRVNYTPLLQAQVAETKKPMVQMTQKDSEKYHNKFTKTKRLELTTATSQTSHEGLVGCPSFFHTLFSDRLKVTDVVNMFWMYRLRQGQRTIESLKITPNISHRDVLSRKNRSARDPCHKTPKTQSVHGVVLVCIKPRNNITL